MVVCNTRPKPTQKMATGDALLSQCGLHGRNRRWEDVRLLKHLRSMWSIQWAEHSAVVELHTLEQFNYRELIPARFGAPVFVLQSKTSLSLRCRFLGIACISHVSVSVFTAVLNYNYISLIFFLYSCSKPTGYYWYTQQYSPQPSFQNVQCGLVLWPFSEQPRGWCGQSHHQSGWSRQNFAPDAGLCSQ